MQNYLTKSRFKLALECPTKLFYTGKKEYANTKLNNEFLIALAEGGFQVGELAKLYYPNGVNIDELGSQKALTLTEGYLKSDNVVLFEAAFNYGDLLIRADVVSKKGNNIRLVEVKSKSYTPSRDKFIGSTGALVSGWKPYLYDVAFQKYVIQNAYPQFQIKAFLGLIDKSKMATVDGLNQKFFISEANGRTKVVLKGASDVASLGDKIIFEADIDELAEKIIKGEFLPDENYGSFDELVKAYADSYSQNYKIKQGIHGKCKACEFKATVEQMAQGYRSGFHECWKEQAALSGSDFEKPLVLDIWDFKKKDELIAAKKYFMESVSLEDLEGKAKKKKQEAVGLSRVDRQWLQVEKVKQCDKSHYFDLAGLKLEMSKWRFPLHLIDFETTAVAIPFNAGLRPYEQIAFQFSHHKIYQDGTVEHSTEWINSKQGIFPNFHFVRELKKALQGDDGSIFRYAPHENTILNAIYMQLQNSNEPDRNDLCDWIKTITKSKDDSVEKWEGARNMIDLLGLVKKYYYDPLMKGSNSLKDVLPAIIKTSDYIISKYSQPIYGSQIKSLNYKDHKWIVTGEDSTPINPYKLLSPINDGYDNELLEHILVDEEAGIADGGAAMIAYARMQFTEMPDEEREKITRALLRYCELDTFAMVVVIEAWQDWCNKN